MHKRFFILFLTFGLLSSPSIIMAKNIDDTNISSNIDYELEDNLEDNLEEEIYDSEDVEQDNIYIINFNSDGGTIYDSIEINSFDNFSLPTSDKEGAAFLGWFTNDGVYVTIDNIQDLFNDNNELDVVAHWGYCGLIQPIVIPIDNVEDDENTKITINFNLYDDLVEVDTFDLNNLIFDYFPIPERKGFAFLGWFTNEGIQINENNYKEICEESKDTLNLYARWGGCGLLRPTIIELDEDGNEIVQEKSIIINFDSNGGTNCDSIYLEITNGNESTTFPTPMKIGYKFLGWYTSDDIQISQYNPCSAFKTLEGNQETTLIAHWKEMPGYISESSYITPIKDSDEYYDITEVTTDYIYYGKVKEITKNRIKNNIVLESSVETILTYPDNSSEVFETSSTFKYEDNIDEDNTTEYKEVILENSSKVNNKNSLENDILRDTKIKEDFDNLNKILKNIINKDLKQKINQMFSKAIKKNIY